MTKSINQSINPAQQDSWPLDGFSSHAIETKSCSFNEGTIVFNIAYCERVQKSQRVHHF
jgi:hypothetical protein